MRMQLYIKNSSLWDSSDIKVLAPSKKPKHMASTSPKELFSICNKFYHISLKKVEGGSFSPGGGGGNLTCLWYGVVPFFRVPFS